MLALVDDNIVCYSHALTDGKLIVVPYLGMMKVRNGLVVEWRDYFDGGLLAKMNKGEFDFANDPAVPLWNRPALF